MPLHKNGNLSPAIPPLAGEGLRVGVKFTRMRTISDQLDSFLRQRNDREVLKSRCFPLNFVVKVVSSHHLNIARILIVGNI